MSSRGEVIRHQNFSRRVWKPALDKAGIEKYVTIHDLRGTAASWLIHRGATIKELAKMLGHADASVTLNRYGHLYDEDMKRLGEAIDVAGRVYA
jgi:site-specific recombinase XerD